MSFVAQHCKSCQPMTSSAVEPHDIHVDLLITQLGGSGCIAKIVRHPSSKYY